MIMVCVVTPGVYWEIEFSDDGEIEVERYISEGVEDGRDAPRKLLELIDGSDTDQTG